MAALLSKSKVLGICGPIQTGDAKLYVDGFAAGAAAAAKANKFKVTAHEVYTGSFSDDSLMATCAKTFVQGDEADVLTGSSQSVVGAIGVAKVGPPGVVRHAVEPVVARAAATSFPRRSTTGTRSCEQMFTAIRGGTLGDATYVIGLGNNGEKIQFNPGYKLSPASRPKARS